MRRTVLLALTLFVLFNPIVAQSDCSCTDRLNWTRTTFEENDAGFAYALEQKGRPAYDAHNAAIAARASLLTASIDRYLRHTANPRAKFERIDSSTLLLTLPDPAIPKPLQSTVS